MSSYPKRSTSTIEARRLAFALAIRAHGEVAIHAAWSDAAKSFNTASMQQGAVTSYFFRLPRRLMDCGGVLTVEGFKAEEVSTGALAALGVDVLALAEVPEALRTWEFWGQFTPAPPVEAEPDMVRSAKFLADLRRRLKEHAANEATGGQKAAP